MSSLSKRSLIYSLILFTLLGCNQKAISESQDYQPNAIGPHYKIISIHELKINTDVQHHSLLKKHIQHLQQKLKTRKSLPQYSDQETLKKKNILSTLRSLQTCIDSDLTHYKAKLDQVFYILKFQPGNKKSLITGYYSPFIQARKNKGGEFIYPLYQPPSSSSFTRSISRIQIDRDQILSGENLEIAWIKDPLEAYLIHVQGSAILQFPNEKPQSIAYAGSNQHQYISLGKELISDGRIPREKMNLQSIRNYFKKHPEQLSDYLWRNPRYIFFKFSDQPPTGSLGTSVQSGLSVASSKIGDLYLYPPYIPIFIHFKQSPPEGFQQSYTAFHEDTGSAIQGHGRYDLYMGLGLQAEKLAGQLQHQAELYYLWPKSLKKPSEFSGLPVLNTP